MKKIYINGDFITLENKTCEAILIEDDKISKVGLKEEILKNKDSETEVIDLEGKTMMPSFIDSHSHFFGVANSFLQISLEECANIKEIQNKLKEYKEKNKLPKDKWVIANNYDQNILEEKKNITREQIDEIIKDNPVAINHKSGHSGVFNTKALEILNITEKTEAPFGGIIEVKNGNLTGLLEENAYIEIIKKVPMPSLDELIEACKKAQEKYLSYGITTVQEGMFVKELIPIYQKLISNNILKADLITYIDLKAQEEIKKAFPRNLKKYYKNMKIAGYKIFLDGSPQLRTAWMKTPYKILNEDDNEYFGFNTMSDEEVKEAVEQAHKENMQILAHCNGDKAAEQYINAIKNQNMESERPVMIHAQLLNIDQLEEIKKYNIIPSFFVAHTYYWGDTHIKNFGIERASKISPLKSALNKKIIFTLHQDSPVIEPNMFETIWCAVNRKTKSSITLGEDEQISVLDGIKAVTINVAYQYFEEDIKGSIKEGKLANLVIVDKNPLKIPKEDIKNIKILETIKEGKTYKRIDT